jgi:hypothetical protein
MKSKISNHKDISAKFSYKTLGEVIHEYFGLEGEYIGLRDSEVVTLLGRNLRKDISYRRSGQIVNCVEMQDYKVDDTKMEAIGDYIKDVLRNDDQQLADSIILTSVDPKLCEKRVELTDSLILEPIYIYISPDKTMEMFKNIENKVLNNQILTRREELEFIIIAIFLDNGRKEEYTPKLCHLFKQYSEVMDHSLNLKISFVLGIMIERNIFDEDLKEKLIKVINMEQKIDSLQEIINEEKQKDRIALKKANTKIKNYEIESKEKDSVIEEQESVIEEQDNVIKEKDELIKKLSEFLTKSKGIPLETLLSIYNP